MIIKLKSKNYATEVGAALAVARAAAKCPAINELAVLVVAQEDRFYPVMLPMAEQLQTGIEVSRATGFTVFRR